ncbi:MAG: TPM domain-containing protein [Chitinophagaceae bacterium]|nr:TPM domain-containing protein [Chitinophagaceae bacterium]
MKFLQSVLLIISFLSLSCKGQKVDKEEKMLSAGDFRFSEKAAGWVSDFEKILTSAQVTFLDSIISRHKEQTTNEIAVVTYNADTAHILTDEDFKEFSTALFNKWGIGEKDKNNGIGILISPNVRKIRIEVGLGLEAKLTNREAKNIIDTVIIPLFKKGEYFTGITKGLEAIFSEIQ